MGDVLEFLRPKLAKHALSTLTLTESELRRKDEPTGDPCPNCGNPMTVEQYTSIRDGKRVTVKQSTCRRLRFDPWMHRHWWTCYVEREVKNV